MVGEIWEGPYPRERFELGLGRRLGEEDLAGEDSKGLNC